MRIIMIMVITVVLLMPCVLFAGECKEHIELYSAEYIAKQLGRSEMWVVGNYKINLWSNPTPQGKGNPVGKLLPGSRAVILQEASEDYKVKSPLDGSIGWINKVQVKKILKQDTQTRKPCK